MEGTKIEKLPCGHEFHEKCIENWFNHDRHGKTCPFCRKECTLYKTKEIKEIGNIVSTLALFMWSLIEAGIEIGIECLNECLIEGHISR